MGWGWVEDAVKDVAKFAVHPFTSIEKPAKKAASKLDDAIGLDMSGYEAGRTAKRAANIQEQAGLEAIAQMRQDLQPYMAQGAELAGMLPQSVLGQGAISTYQAPQQLQAYQPANVTAQDVMRDPFFGHLAEQQEERLLRERAGLGLAGSGGTRDLLQRNLLTMGEGFRQQRQAEELERQNQMFNQNLLGSNLGMQQQAQQYTQEAGLQQQRFNQLMGGARLGQQSAALTGAQGADITTGIGAANSAAALAQQQARQARTADALGLGGAIISRYLIH